MLQKKISNVSRLPLFTTLLLIVIVFILVLIWCWWKHPLSVAPCTGGTANVAPADYVFYENEELGYRFAYPSSWGTVSVTTTAISDAESGNYIMGSFSDNDQVTFGGNATDYVVRGRDGMPTDLPGFLEASGKFYLVNIWRYDNGLTIEDRHDLHPITEPYTVQAGCNTKALVTRYEASELRGAYDLARLNLQSSNQYYGVNFVVSEPTATLRTQITNLLKTFQLIP